jgi:hypothetical protein
VRYETYWKTLFVMGDYKSAMIICRDNCPSNPFPISLKTAVNYMRFCVMEKGTILRDIDTNQAIVNRHGQEMICVGVWTAQSTAVGFKSAISKVCQH